METNYPYPEMQIDPRQKGFDWVIQYCKAAWSDGKNYMPSIMQFTSNINQMAERKQYAMGKQSISKYKLVQAGDEVEDNTDLNNDGSVLAVIPKFREIAISKILQKEYYVEAFTIDPLAKSEEDAYFNQMKAKIMMRQMAAQAGSPLANSPSLRPNPKEPEDLEQLQIEMDFGYKHVMAMEAEEGVQLIFEQNKMPQERKENVECLYDWGIGGYKVWIDENGMVKYRAISGEYIIVSYCQKSDYADAAHAGEIIFVQVADLAPYFNPAQREQIARNVAGRYGNPSTFDMKINRWWDKFQVAVLDLQFFSYNTTVFEEKIDGRGNTRFGKTEFSNIQYVNREEDMKGGEAYPKYMNSVRKVVYKGKWLIGTEFMYDYGLKENQNRKLSSWWDTQLDYVIGSWSFYKMQYSGIMERLIPIADAYQLTWRRLQTFKNKLIPYLIEIDFAALEKVGLGKGGKDWSPNKILDFAFKNFILVKRTTSEFGNNPNYKAMDIRPTGELSAFTQLYADLDRLYMMLQQISGLNEVTDGSTIDQKTLNGATAAMQTSTNNALYLITECDRRLTERLADIIVQKIQIAVKLGKVEGYAKALGTSAVKFLSINPDIALCELGIFIRDMPTEEERSMLLQELNLKDSQGLIEPSDKIMVQSMVNLKQATMYLAYAVKKRREEAQQNQMALVQQQTQGNAQAGMQIEQMKQQTITLQGKIQAGIETLKWQGQYQIEAMKKNSDQTEAQIQAQAKVISAQIQASAKQAASSFV